MLRVLARRCRFFRGFHSGGVLLQQDLASARTIDDIVDQIAREYIAPVNATSKKIFTRPNEEYRESGEISRIFKEVTRGGTELSKKKEIVLTKTIEDKVSSITEVSQLFELLNTLPKGHLPHRSIFVPIAVKIQNMIPHMGTNNLVALLDCLKQRYYRDVDLLTQMAEQLIRSHEPLALIQISSIAHSMSMLTFDHPRLVKYLVANFVKQLDTFHSWMEIAHIASSFSSMRINSPTFWLGLCKWMDANMETARLSPPSVSDIVYACSGVNVPGHLLKKSIEFVVNDLKGRPRVEMYAIKYLNIVRGLAIFKALSYHEANRVIQPEFFEEIKRQYSTKFGALSEAANLLTMRSAIRILEVAASCRFDLSIQPKVPENLLRYVEENPDKVEKFRYGKRLFPIIEEFRHILYLVAPLKTHATAPRLDIQTGSYIDAVLWICPEKKTILSLEEGEKSPNAEKVAVVFASYLALTATDAGTSSDAEKLPLNRQMGEVKMNLRHLRANNFKPVLIDYYTFSSISEVSKKARYIKESILQPYDVQLDEDWH